jgi:hypothetical protein
MAVQQLDTSLADRSGRTENADSYGHVFDVGRQGGKTVWIVPSFAVETGQWDEWSMKGVVGRFG